VLDRHGRQCDAWAAFARITAIADVGRDDIEDYKVWLAGQHRSAGQVISRETYRQWMRTSRQFFERIPEWDWSEAPTASKQPEPTAFR
jgi:hypothetical protein